MNWYSVDWRDPTGTLWKDIVPEPTYQAMQANPNVTIVRDSVWGDGQ